VAVTAEQVQVGYVLAHDVVEADQVKYLQHKQRCDLALSKEGAVVVRSRLSPSRNDIVGEALAGASVHRRALGATTVVMDGLTALSAQRYGRVRPGLGLVSPESQPLELHNHLKSDRPPQLAAARTRRALPCTPNTKSDEDSEDKVARRSEGDWHARRVERLHS